MVLVNREMVATQLQILHGKKIILINIQGFSVMFLRKCLSPVIYQPVHHWGLIWATNLLEILAEKRMNVQGVDGDPRLVHAYLRLAIDAYVDGVLVFAPDSNVSIL